MPYTQAQLQEKIIQVTNEITTSYQTWLKIYSTPEVKIMLDLEEIKQELPKVNLDTSSETQEQSVESGEKARRKFS